ncbi:amino acid transporter [Aspergillus violaceofuscus CBS 115571]|uniref:Amino acid transporter n=1 Tax=Aspergillus violaceofuscus (strain CBS 115571) TaxID=1450538 RepID=A0A2V5H8P2_ASPV1|nr:amino acid transporter [Aspergillus violaceofuscus CBS 115571]
MPVRRETPERLKQELFGFQIFFITLSAVIGSGIFVNNGSALAISGPLGLILAALIMSVVVLSVNECVAELTQQFPVYNAIVEYVRTFVDDDLGWVIGLVYWYAYAASFASQNSMAGSLLAYWGLGTTWRALICYALAPIVFLLLNLTGVFWYGIVETIGGFLKLIMIVSISIYLYAIAGNGDTKGIVDASSPRFEAGMGFENSGHAACFAIPITAYAFQGIELYAMAAFEARDAHAIRWPSRWISYVVVVVYIMCTVGEILTVSWNDNRLPRLHDGTQESTFSATSSVGSASSMIILAALNTKSKAMAGFLNGCLLFSAFSAANTSLYVASRTLYGIARSMPREFWITKKLSILSQGTRVPVGALLATVLAFCWVPFLRLNNGFVTQQVVQVVSTSASNAIMIVWAAICLAFLRYYYWLKKHDPELRHSSRPEFIRDSPQYTPRGSLLVIQPVQAWVGLIGCVAIFAFSSATWWGSHATVTEVAMAYGAHLVVVLLLVVLKVCRRRKEWFRATPSAVQLLSILNDLRVRKIDRWEPTTLERVKKVSVLLLRRYRNSSPEVAQSQEPQELYGRVVVSQHDTNGLAKFRTPVPVPQPRDSSDV